MTANIETLRAEYATRRDHAAYDNATRAQFDAACRELVGESASPEAWLKATDRVRFCCRRCAGSGQFVTGTVNGRPTGPGGACYRCQGRGSQSWVDGQRNAYRDLQAFGREARAMFRSVAA
jgi:hypothetical protein